MSNGKEQQEKQEGFPEQDGQEAKECEGSLNPPSDDFEYKVKGLEGQGQVEPTATAWLTGHAICVPQRDQVLEYSEGAKAEERWHVTQADFPTEAQLASQFTTLRQLAADRHIYPYPAGETYGSVTLTPLSRFLQLQPPPFGTIFDVVAHDTVGIPENEVNKQHLRILKKNLVIDQGQELARAFESETPGLYHRHALNWIFYSRPDVSPVRQARVWMALDIAIYTALSTAWYYKWSHPSYSRLLRPSEYAERCSAKGLSVLYNWKVDDDGQEDERTKRPGDKPGTPRHPAWPSGHSTYSAAASHLLEYFFSPDTLRVDDQTVFNNSPPESKDIGNPMWIAAELRRLANNIGEARLWAGVHWHADHIAGQKIGRAAAQTVIEQFLDDCIVPFTDPPIMDPPDRATLDQVAADARECPDDMDQQERRHDFITQRPDREALGILPPF